MDFFRTQILGNNSIIVAFTIALLVAYSIYVIFLLKQKKQYLLKQKVKDIENRTKKDFIANINHEIRTPVNVISGMIHLLSQQDFDGQTKSYLEKIKLANHDIKNVIDDVLDFNKFYGENIKARNKEVNFHTIIDSLKEDFSLPAEQKGLNLSFIVGENVPKILKTDGYLLKSVCQKLLDNAIKFTKEGTVNFKVNLIQGNDSVVRLKFEITDTGIGMSSDQVKEIFKAFKQGDGSKSRTYGGIGIGLFLAEKMLEALSTKMKIITSPDGGTNISFAILVKYVEESLSDAEICKGKKVMFVDDDLINRQIGQTLLNDLGTEPTILSSGQAVLDNINQTFDALIIDIKMPDMEGTEVSQKLREMGYDKLPILALTGNSEAADLDEYKKAGMISCIEKPIDFEVLKGSLANVFKGDGPTKSFTKIEKAELVADSEILSFDPNRGIRLINNDKDLYNEILTKFKKDFADAPKKLEYFVEAKDFKAGELLSHSIKGISGSIGANPLSNLAKTLEQDFKARSKTDLTEFSKELKIVIREIGAYLPSEQKEAEVKKKDGGTEELKDLLSKLKDATSKNDPVTTKQIITEISSYKFSGTLNDSISALKEAVSAYDFTEANKIIDNMNKSLEG